MASHRDVVDRLLRLADALTQRMGDVLQPHRLTLSQYGVLEVLREAGEDGLACGEIAERMATRDPDVTRMLDRLEDRGLISRRRGRPDRRVVRSQLTDEGAQVLVVLHARIRDVHAEYLGTIDARNLGTLHALLGVASAPERATGSIVAATIR